MSRPFDDDPQHRHPPHADGGRTHLAPEDNVLALANKLEDVKAKELVERYQSGDALALDLLFQGAIYPASYKHAARIVGPLRREELAELVQKTAVRVLQRLTSFDGRGPFYAWLRTVLVNEHLRRRPSRFSEADLAEVQVPEREDALVEAETVAAVREALMTLSETDRACILAVYFDGLSHEEAGNVLKLTAKAVTERCSRAREKLRTVLACNPLARTAFAPILAV